MTEVFHPIGIDSLDKHQVFLQAEKLLDGLEIIDRDEQRPWGFFLSVNEDQSAQFIDRFYEGIDLSDIDTSLPLTPKILGVAPYQRLSWQYHHRRNEKWRCLGGHLHVITSPTDNETDQILFEPGDTITIPCGIRHRGAGLEKWALIAEIWQHTDRRNLSDEDDIIRVQDDHGR